MSSTTPDFTSTAQIHEYGSAANPEMPPIPVLVHPPELHEQGPTRIIPFDLSQHLNPIHDDQSSEPPSSSPATSPNLLASFVRIQVGDQIDTTATATSQAFYVIRGSGSSTSQEHGTIAWNAGDLFVLPQTPGAVTHACESSEAYGAAAIYWIHDAPLLEYLGVLPSPKAKTFEPTLYKREKLLEKVEEIRHDDTRSNNRLGVLLGNTRYEHSTKTLTHVLWSLLNSIGPHSIQRPHRHNSVALDLCVSAPSQSEGSVYTLMGREIDAHGFIIDPLRVDWVPGGCFVTPPGWWHSHHNESNSEAWVLPIQDAGLLTHQRTLDIRFVDDELALHHAGRIRGSAFVVSDEQWEQLYDFKFAQTDKENSATTTSEDGANGLSVPSVNSNETSTMEATMVDSSHAALGYIEREDSATIKGTDSKTLPKRRYSIQVGHLARQGLLTSLTNTPDESIPTPSDEVTDIRHRQSTQVGADLKQLSLPRDL